MVRTSARLKDIALATGFSANTVSLALRESRRIPKATRDRILAAARQLNYLPNHVAQSLVSRETKTIGLVLTDIMNPTLTLAARSIERELASRGYSLMLAATDSSYAPWHLVRSDDKRRARLNCISHVLASIPYKKVARPKVKLLKRSTKGKYDDQASLKGRRFVAERY